MKLADALQKAQTESALHKCGQHVLFKVTRPVDDTTAHGYYYVSDWYDGDCTVATYFNGVKKEA